jgi:hypothetical protein
VEVKKGKTRVVIIAGGIAVKFPRFSPRYALKSSLYYFGKGTKHIIHFLKWRLKGIFLEGVICNFREFLFYRSCRMPILSPTYFSLFGLINFQKAGKSLEMEPVDFWLQMVELAGKELGDDCHTFSEPDNFIVINGKPRIVDYATSETQKVLKLYGDKIFNKLDLNFRRAKAKK